jgi:hypothetical protein
VVGGEDREGIYGLSVTNEFTIRGGFLRVQMVAQDLVKALEADAIRLLFLIVANLGPAPDTLDREFFVLWLCFFHG